MQGAGTLLCGPQGEPCVHLGLPGGPGRVGQPLAGRGVRFLLGGGLGRGQPLLQLGEAGTGLLAGGLGGGDLGGQPLGLATGGPGDGAVLRQLLGHGGQGRVGLVQPRQRDVDPVGRVEPPLLQGLRLEREPFDGVGGPGQLLGGLVDRRLHLDQAGRGRGAAGGEVRAEQVAVAGDRRDVGQLVDELLGRDQLLDDRDLEQQPRERRPQVVGALDDVHRVHGALGQPGPRGVIDAGPAEQDAGAAEVVGLEVVDGTDRGVDVTNRDRVGGAAQGRGDGGLVAGLHREQGGHRAEHAGDRVGRGEQRTGAVLAVEAHLEGLLAGGQRRPLTVGRGGLLAGRGQLVLEVGEQRAG